MRECQILAHYAKGAVTVSTNCVVCIKRDRDGLDGMCEPCRSSTHGYQISIETPEQCHYYESHKLDFDGCPVTRGDEDVNVSEGSVCSSCFYFKGLEFG